jgi:hypothetical protein
MIHAIAASTAGPDITLGVDANPVLWPGAYVILDLMNFVFTPAHLVYRFGPGGEASVRSSNWLILLEDIQEFLGRDYAEEK